MKYKILVLDLDGTLTNSKKEITPRVKKAILAAQEKGVTVVLASGRPTYGIVPLAEELEIGRYGGYILSYNGGQIINWESQNVVYEKVLSTDVFPYLYLCAKENGFVILSYKGECILSEDSTNEYVRHEAFLNKMKSVTIDNFLDEFTMPVPKCLIVGNPDGLSKLEKEMKAQLEEKMNVFRSEPFFLELVPLGIDKALSLNILLKKLGMKAEEMIACGDGFNDLSMIQLAGLGVAMANAQSVVKESANYITLSNDEDGVADVVERFILADE